ncbi:MAG: hupB [Ignavibacteriaceae bacterium]|jgi:DNA-binding protein HU-beta|nr:hupB [Ignavibacteriaceae bacterium]
MAKSMTKSQIIAHLAAKTKTTKKVSAQFLDELVKLSYKEAKKEFVLPGLGKLKVAQRNQRMGRNPATGESIVIPARKVLKFRISKAAKDAILK